MSFPIGIEITTAGSILVTSATKEQIQALNNTYHFNKHDLISYNDTCLFIIDDALNVNRNGKITNCKDSFLVLPNIKTLLDSNDITQHLISSFEVFIIEEKTGRYLDEEYIDNKTQNLIIPGHGYSKGIIFSSRYNYLFYWAIIW